MIVTNYDKKKTVVLVNSIPICKDHVSLSQAEFLDGDYWFPTFILKDSLLVPILISAM